MLLSRDEIEKSIANCGWKWLDNSIIKSYKFNNYINAISFVNAIADISERINHHPSMHIGYCDVDITISSYDLGGVSTKCINLATQIDDIYAK